MQEHELYDGLEKDLAHFARAIGHPARIALLVAIAKHGKVEGGIISIPQLSPATVLQHLRELKRAGLIQGKIFGSRSVYYVDPNTIARFNELFGTFCEALNANANQDRLKIS